MSKAASSKVEITRHDEQDVDAVLILDRKLKLRSITGQLFPGEVLAYEVLHPYCLILTVSTQHEHSIRCDIHKEMLARELRLWLDGKLINSPVLIIPQRIEDAVDKFVKFGKPPMQEDLIMWILSRCELSWGTNANILFGGFENPTSLNTLRSAEMSRLSETKISIDQKNKDDVITLTAQYPQTIKSIKDEDDDDLDTCNKFDNPTNTRPRTAPVSRSKQLTVHDGEWMEKSNPDMNSYYLTRKMLGKSEALSQLPKSKVPGRQAASKVLAFDKIKPEHLELGAYIERARKDVEEAMEERRMAIEVCKERQKQTAEKYVKIREKVKEDGSGRGWFDIARSEISTLQKVYDDIKEDTKKQKNRALRESQQIFWTIAPQGYVNLRGRWVPGPKIGAGPLPSTATSKLKDPRVDLTLKKYYWDTEGRRHSRDEINWEADMSVTDRVMDCIRRAATNASSHKLDLKKVFEGIDTSGDGFIGKAELSYAFETMGVKVDQAIGQALWDHFDPNRSGSINYGEFVWSFFNRRAFVRQYKKSVSGLTEVQIASKFHHFDSNGNGTLTPKELGKLISSLGIVMTDLEQQVLISKFDIDGDGEIDVGEFRQFVEKNKVPDPNDRDRQKKRSGMKKRAVFKARAAAVGVDSSPEREAHDVQNAEQALRCLRLAALRVEGDQMDLKSVFDEVDTSRDNMIGEKELLVAFEKMGVTVPPTLLSALFTRFDTNKNGKITFGEFSYVFFNRHKVFAADDLGRNKTFPGSVSKGVGRALYTEKEEEEDNDDDDAATVPVHAPPAFNDERIDAGAMAGMLERQSQVESKLGRQYYRK